MRTSLAAVHEVVQDAGRSSERRCLVNYLDSDDPATGTNTAYGWAKTWSNVFRTGLPGDAAERSVTYLGTIDNFLAGQTDHVVHRQPGYDDIARQHFCEAFWPLRPGCVCRAMRRSRRTSCRGSRSSPRRRSCS